MNKSKIEWTDEKLAYLAGVIDCDGYITIQRCKKKRKSTDGSTYYRFYFSVKIGIAGTRNEPHILANKLFGGSVSEYQPKNKDHRTQYQWHCQSKMARDFLEVVYPFLRVKKEQAKLAIRFQDMVDSQYEEMKSDQIPPYTVTEEMEKHRERLWRRMINLNQSRKNIRADHNIKEMAATNDS